MLGNCDKKMITNQWPQPQQQKQISSAVDDRIRMASSSPNKVGAAADPNPLKCPRCDSSNTKFCYYNNYSLSQPRHFCKACKRYWTRGGTLRNVPVGGGCRKNKRPKRHSSTAHPHIDPPPPPPPQPLFYTNTPLELNFPFSTFRVSSDDQPSFDLHPQINSLGLGFSSDLSSFSSPANNTSIFFGSSSTASTMASLLASTHKFGEDPAMGKQVKAEGDNRMPWISNPTDQINSSDPSSLPIWNASTIGAWFDPSSMGSSVPSLI